MKFKTESCRHVKRPSFRYSLHPEMTCMSVSGEKQNEQSADDDRPHLGGGVNRDTKIRKSAGNL